MAVFIESGKALFLEGETLKAFVETKETERIEREEEKENEKFER